MNISKIEFKISLDNKKYCNKCFKHIDAKEGFIFIIGNIKMINRWDDKNGRANLCLDCFNEFIKNMKKYSQNKKEIYEGMVKKKVIKGLK